MSRIALVVLIVVTVSQAWSGNEIIDPITDESIQRIWVDANDVVYAGEGMFFEPVLCVEIHSTFKESSLFIYVRWFTNLSDMESLEAITRVDTERPVEYEVVPHQDNTIFASSSDLWMLFAQLLRGEQFVVRISPRNGRTETAIFPLDGITAAAREVNMPVDWVLESYN